MGRRAVRFLLALAIVESDSPLPDGNERKETREVNKSTSSTRWLRPVTWLRMDGEVSSVAFCVVHHYHGYHVCLDIFPDQVPFLVQSFLTKFISRGPYFNLPHREDTKDGLAGT